MTSDRLTAVLAERVMGWTVAPDRFLMSDRRWIPRRRFQPLSNLEHAFQLLERAASTFTLATTTNGTFTARIRVGNHVGIASGEPKARAISLAIAEAIGLDTLDQTVSPSACNDTRQKHEEAKR